MDNQTGYVFIAGASSDIGFAIAEALEHHNYSLILHCSSEKGLAKLNSRFGAKNTHQITQLDFSEVNILGKKLADLFSKYPIKGLVNCVGLRSRRPLRLLKYEHVQDIFQVNFFAFLEMIRVACSKDMYLNGLSVVQISSVSAESGGASLTAYSASKAAADNMVRSLAKELLPKGIRLNSIRCGQVDSEAYQEFLSGKEEDPSMVRQYGGLIDTDDISELVLFLLSAKSNRFTGQYFNLDGGYLQ
jgi:NAD(P)-dependent dehydrogenase (short-subunit alcohol dehydrogenase family)